MRRLIALLGHPVRSIRQQASEQHIADLEKMLSGLIDARDRLDGEIADTTRRLFRANQHHQSLVAGLPASPTAAHQPLARN